jgi:hypothetical protein
LESKKVCLAVKSENQPNICMKITQRNMRAQPKIIKKNYRKFSHRPESRSNLATPRSHLTESRNHLAESSSHLVVI